jgi:hypothetical protein
MDKHSGFLIINYFELKWNFYGWKKAENNCWIGIVQNRLWRIWREDESKIGFKIMHNFRAGNAEMNENNGGEILKEYFQVILIFYLDIFFITAGH